MISLVSVVTYTYIDERVTRLYTQSLIFLLALILHLLAYPYKSVVLNRFQAALYTLLVILASINNYWASLRSDLMYSNERRRIGKILVLVETVVLILPLPLLILFAILTKWSRKEKEA